MSGLVASRLNWKLLGLLMLGVMLTPEAGALEAVNGRIQAHGFFEMQLRTLNRNFSDQWDVAQWYNIFNLELEFDLVQDTHGPLDLLSAYVRIEARFDCIYSRGCGMFKGIDAYGDRSRALPRRLSNAHENVAAGSILLSDAENPPDRLSVATRDPVPLSSLSGSKAIG